MTLTARWFLALPVFLPIQLATAQLSVQVAPDNGTHPDPKIRLANSTGNTVVFTVINNGTIDAQFSRTCIGLGNVSNVTCGLVGIIAAGDSKAVTVTFDVGATGTGSAQLTVTSVVPTGVSNVGKWDETIVAGAAQVTPDGGTATQAPNQSGRSQAFTVTNLARAAGTYALSVNCTGLGISACTVPSSIILDSAGVAAGTGTATVTYNTGGPGLTGTITLTASYGGTSLDLGTVTVLVPSAQVLPKNQAVSVNPNAAQTQVFSITNSGPVSVTYTLTPVCSGAGVTAGCSVSPTSITPPNNGVPVSATVTYASLASGATGLVVLRATYGGVVLDTGFVNVTVTTPPPAAVVAPQGGVDGQQVTVPAGTSTNTQVFTVQNSGGGGSTYTLTPACSGTGVPAGCTVVPTSVAVSAGQTGTATVTYTTLAGGTSGKVVLRAAVAGTVLDTGYVTVAVAGASVVPLNLADGATVSLGPSLTVNQPFTITNTGTTTTTYAVASACTGAGIASCVLSPTSIAVGQGLQGTVNVQFQTQSVGTTAKIVVRALLNGTVLDTGWVTINVDAQPGAPNVTTAAVNPGPTRPRDQCVTIALGAAAAAECGDLRIIQAIPAVKTLNVWRAPTLLYNAAYAEPTPQVGAVVRIFPQVVRPDSVIGTLKRAGVQVGRGSWAGTQWTAGGPGRIIRVRDTTAAPATGLVAYVLEVANKYNAGGTFPTVVPVDVVVINRKTSPYGQGWWVAGLEQVAPIAGSTDVLWIGGDGSARRFTKITTTLWRGLTPLVAFPDSLTLASNGAVREYTRRLPGGLSVVFDSANGRHLRTVNRLGYTTSFGYDGSGRLLTIGLPGPGTARSFTFGYPAGQVTVSDGLSPVRVTTLTVSGGRVTTITDPANNPVTFGYAGTTGLVTSRTDREGGVLRLVLDSLRHVTRTAISANGGVNDSIVVNLAPAESQGLRGTPSVDSAGLFTLYRGPRGIDTTTFFVNPLGASARIVNAANATTTLTRAGVYSGLVTQVTTVTGQVISATYDGLGRLVTVTDLSTSPSRTTRYEWGSADQLTKIAPPAGDSTVFVVASNGNRSSATDTRGQTTAFGYNGNNQVNSVTLPGLPAQLIGYDGQGNLSSVTTPLGFVTGYTNNDVGLPITMTTPITGGTLTTTAGYNKWNQETSRLVGQGAGEWNNILTGYDKEGRTVSVSRSFTPNPANISTLVDSWGYDKVGRALTVTRPGGGTEQRSYDVSGNLVSVTTPRSHVIGMGYDAMNRMITRTVPQAIGATHLGNSIIPNSLTTAPYGETVPGDNQGFTYYPDGQIASATGCDANVSRTFDPNGEMRSETLTIRGITAGCGTASHTYTTAYTYDGDGRRATMTVPAVFGGAGSTATYFYDAATGGGRLTAVSDPALNVFTFTYKPSGELTQIAEPGNERRNLSWDSDGRLLTDQVVRPVGCGTDWPCFNGNGPFRNTSFTAYDPQGRLLNASDAATFAETTTASYTPLGHLKTTTETQQWIGPYVAYNVVTYTAAETLTHDGLGNLAGRQEGWTVATGGSSTTTNTASSAAFDASGRQTGLSPGGGAGTWSKSYDAAGNVEWEQRVTNPNPAEERASFYAADQTLAVVDRRTGTTRWYEHYRYDPLGRRVLVISQVQCAPFNSLECYASRIRRTIWDGAQELGEIQVPYDSTDYWENDTGPYPRPYFLQHGSSATGDPNPLFGQVLYGPGVAVDQPLSVIRFKYTDRSNQGAVATTWPTFTLLPQWNHRGVATFGVFSTGVGYKSYDGVDQANCPILGDTTGKRCVVVQWVAGQSAYDQQRGGQEKLSWFGTVIEGKRDGAGLEYKRNRYYDPQGGRFTQQDPIGVAGGLNLYGFANGDPVNFSDPFGLCPPADNNISDCPADQKFIHLTSGALRARASQTVDDYITLATTIGTGGEGAALAAAGGTGRVVIGETMERVISYAEKVGADWYKARGKNAANWLRNNLQWLRRQMKAGKEVIDIGEDALRAERSSAYAAEKALLERRGYPTTSVPPP